MEPRYTQVGFNLISVQVCKCATTQYSLGGVGVTVGETAAEFGPMGGGGVLTGVGRLGISMAAD